MRIPTARSRVVWTAVIAAVLIYTLVAIARDPIRIHHDCALNLQAGSLLLEGRLPYVDVVDLNPPLIMYLSVIPAMIAVLTKAPPIVTFLTCVWLLTVWSTLVTRKVLAATFAPHESNQADLVALAIAASSLIALQNNEYGQREHLFVLGFFPYLAFRFRRWEGAHSPTLPAVTAGLLAGLTTCLKPHFVLIALAPECYWLVTRRRTEPLFRPELMAFVAVGVAYAAHFLMMPVAVRTAFFGRWLPLVVGAYHVYDLPMGQLLRSSPLFRSWPSLGLAWYPAVASLIVLLLRPRRVNVAWRLAGPLAVVVVAATAMFFAQQKGWSYQALPIGANAVVLLALCVGQVARRPPAVSVRTDLERTAKAAIGAAELGSLVIAMCLALGAVAFASHRTVGHISDLVSRQPVARAIVDASRAGDPVLFISSSVPHSYPILVQLGRRPGSRFLFCFPIPLLYSGVVGSPGQPFPYRGADGAPAPGIEEAAFLADLAADIETIRPKAVFIDTSTCAGCPEGFVIHDYLERTAFVTNALGRYHRAGLVADLVLYLPTGEQTP